LSWLRTVQSVVSRGYALPTDTVHALFNRMVSASTPSILSHTIFDSLRRMQTANRSLWLPTSEDWPLVLHHLRLVATCATNKQSTEFPAIQAALEKSLLLLRFVFGVLLQDMAVRCTGGLGDASAMLWHLVADFDLAENESISETAMQAMQEFGEIVASGKRAWMLYPPTSKPCFSQWAAGHLRVSVHSFLLQLETMIESASPS